MGTFRKAVIANAAGAIIPLLRQPIEDVIYDTLDRRQFPTRSEVRELNTRLEKVQAALEKLSTAAEVAEASLTTLRQGVEGGEEARKSAQDLLAAVQQTASAARDTAAKALASMEQLRASASKAPAPSAAGAAPAPKAAASKAVPPVAVSKATPKVAASKAAPTPPVETPEKLAPAAVPKASDAEAGGEGQKRKRGRPRIITDDMQCRVEGCSGKVRSKGLCAKHYQQWRREMLSGFVSPSGLAVSGANRYRFDKRHAGKAIAVVDDGERVTFTLDGKDTSKTRKRAFVDEITRRPRG